MTEDGAGEEVLDVRKKELETFAQIVKTCQENKDRTSIVRQLFTLVPDLDTIPKEARQQVLAISRLSRSSITLF
jgi:hypothetical protein